MCERKTKKRQQETRSHLYFTLAILQLYKNSASAPVTRAIWINMASSRDTAQRTMSIAQEIGNEIQMRNTDEIDWDYFLAVKFSCSLLNDGKIIYFRLWRKINSKLPMVKMLNKPTLFSHRFVEALWFFYLFVRSISVIFTLSLISIQKIYSIFDCIHTVRQIQLHVFARTHLNVFVVKKNPFLLQNTRPIYRNIGQ